jgi:3-hydroxy-3-methylglutaryl CoA synthase
MGILVGISHINLHAGSFSLDTQALAQKRQVNNKVLYDTGFTRRSVAAPWEDSLTYAVNAASPIFKTVDPGQIGLLIVATESGLDYGKPISTYVHKLLGLSSSCTNFEIKHACYGGTAAVQMAIAWQKANPDSNKKALVICTDLARCHLTDLAEFTSGTASVAMIIDKDPQLVIIHPERGCGTKEVYDVARPTLNFEWGDPVLSLYSYMDLLELSWGNYEKINSRTKLNFTDLDYIAYHTPLVSLIRSAHSLLLENTNHEDSPQHSFEKMCEPILKYNHEVSNIYSGSLYAVLIGIIEKAWQEKRNLNVGCFSYGSGACSEFYTCTVLADGMNHILSHHIEEKLRQRIPLTVAQYEHFMRNNMNSNIVSEYQSDLTQEFLEVEHLYRENNWVFLDKIENYYRQYRRL